MQHCDTLIVPRWCVPAVPAGAVLEGHAVAVSEGRIDAILPLLEARTRYQPSALIERPDHVLIPGLVNAHTHAAMTLFRGLADDLRLEAWLREHIWPAERRWVSPELVRDGAELAIAEMLRGGTTCFSDQYFFPEIVAQAATDLSMRAVVATPVADFKSSWAGNAAEYLQKATDLVQLLRDSTLSIWAISRVSRRYRNPRVRHRRPPDRFTIFTHIVLRWTMSCACPGGQIDS